MLKLNQNASRQRVSKLTKSAIIVKVNPITIRLIKNQLWVLIKLLIGEFLTQNRVNLEQCSSHHTLDIGGNLPSLSRSALKLASIPAALPWRKSVRVRVNVRRNTVPSNTTVDILLTTVKDLFQASSTNSSNIPTAKIGKFS